MATITLAATDVELNEEGFFVHPEQWTDDMAPELARREGIDALTDAHWQVISGREEFFNVTKLMHNSLQGDEQVISDQQWEVFEAYNAMNAQDLEEGWDVIIVHDPQPAGLFGNAPDKSRHWIWRCHIDLSTPNPDTIARLLPLISRYEASVWHLEQYVPAGLDGGVRIVPPAIDGERKYPALTMSVGMSLLDRLDSGP